MRSTGVLSFYIWIFSSFFLFVCGFVAGIIYNDGFFMIPIWGLILYFPMLPIHAGLIVVLKKWSYEAEDMKWMIGLSSWVCFGCIFMFTLQKLEAITWLFFLMFGGCSYLGVLATFSMPEPKPTDISTLPALYPVDSSVQDQKETSLDSPGSIDTHLEQQTAVS